MLAEGGYLRTGDLGRIDADGYIWITGRAKDLIIRGGHNIDPALIEDAMMHHPAGRLRRRDRPAGRPPGELPAVYVELVAGGTAAAEELMAHRARPASPSRRRCRSTSRSLPELPKTAVGKVFKPDLRRRAITRVFDAALAEAGCAARVAEVVEDPPPGARRRARPPGAKATRRRSAEVLGRFTVPWRWRRPSGAWRRAG